MGVKKMEWRKSANRASTVNVALHFSEPSAAGAYFFSVPDEQFDAFMELALKHGGILELATSEKFCYGFHGQNSCVIASDLASRHMFKH